MTDTTKTRILSKDTPGHIGENILIQGWIDTRRDHGKLVFLDVRDRSGIVQVVVLPNSEAAQITNELKPESVIELHGMVNARPEKMVNPNIASGTVELLADTIKILSSAKTPPFELQETKDVNEELRLKYRYLDLRTQRLQRNIKLRSEFIQNVREFLFKNDFTEIETPMLTKSTPEGSRDFVVPSRLQPGKFYALPQSPQQYKQLLMVAGFERYFQIARCIRDEDFRAHRGAEFTQIDLEMSFVDREAMMNIVEEMVTYTVEKMGFKIKEKPFPRITYTEAMEKYGDDKFDLRTEEEKQQGILAYAWVIDFPFFEKTEDGGWTFTHNPFSMPLPESLENHMSGTNIESILTTQYDLVCNGFESGGGSIRAHTPETLKATYKIMGYTDEQINDSVGHMLEAFAYGTPPHGGIALGVERNIMNLTQEDYLREVQAFPTTASGNTAVMDAPSELNPQQLKDLGLQIIENKK